MISLDYRQQIEQVIGRSLREEELVRVEAIAKLTAAERRVAAALARKNLVLAAHYLRAVAPIGAGEASFFLDALLSAGPVDDPLPWLTDPPTWTDAEIRREKDRRLGTDLRDLGPRPGWWRPSVRKRYDRQVRWLKKVHDADLRAMLDESDSQKRAIRALLIGWWPETQGM